VTGFLFVLGELCRSLRGRSAAWIAMAFGLVLVFVLAFSGLVLLGGGGPLSDQVRPGRGEVFVHTTGGPGASGIQALYSRILERSDVRSVRVLLTNGETILVVRAVSPVISSGLVQDLEALPGVTSVDAPGRGGLLFVPNTWLRASLLAALALSLIGALLVARTGFRDLLAGFDPEIKLLRASGVGERTIQGPIVALGLLVGLAASLLGIAIVSLAYLGLAAHPEAVPALAAGILEPVRVRTACLLALPLGPFLGVLAGALGAVAVASRTLES